MLCGCQGPSPSQAERAEYRRVDARFDALTAPCDDAFARAVAASRSGLRDPDRLRMAGSACRTAGRGLAELAFDPPIYPEESTFLKRAVGGCAAAYGVRAEVLQRLGSADPKTHRSIAAEVRNVERSVSLCLVEYRSIAVGAGYVPVPHGAEGAG